MCGRDTKNIYLSIYLWSVEKLVEKAADVFCKFDINVDEFNIARDLHNVLNSK